MSTLEKPQLDFTQDWVSHHLPVWEAIIPRDLRRVLEIGSFEGRSACWFLQHALNPAGTLYAIDTWEGSPEFWMLPSETISGAHERFRKNTAAVKRPDQIVVELEGTSYTQLARIAAVETEPYFDLVYVDGSHRASDVLTDLCMAWPLLKRGGLLIADDYLWDQTQVPEDRPKPALDAFTNLFWREMAILFSGNQVIVQKR